MRRLLLLFCLCSATVFGQKIYLQHEVEKPAEPAGGHSQLGQFIATNIQIPFLSSVKGINGRVYVKGVVEPDGSMSQLEVSRGLDSLTNKEAVRVLRLYKAWKPALIKGEKVRQSIVYPISFKTPANTSFDSSKFALVNYFDSKYRLTTDSKKYEFRSVMPVNEQGYIKQDVIYEQLKGSKWKEVARVPFKKKEIWHHMDFLENGADSVKAYLVFARDDNEASHSSEAIFQMNGKLISYTEYGPNNKASLIKKYDLSGMVRDLHVPTDSADLHLSWFDNGQIKSVTEDPVPRPNEYRERILANAWTSDGMQLVKDGEGHWQSVTRLYQGKLLWEQGPVVKGKKDGKWQGKWKDGTVHYDETYDNGTLKEGIAYEDGQKRTYQQAVIQPQFKGGINHFYRFLGENIVYPSEASRRGVSGRVFLSFVVCEDGSMCDYKVLKGVGFGIDEEALRVVKKMSGMWDPGVLRGKIVPVKYNLPVNFQLQ
ncbi:energy transducer TonB [Dyadobacter psychrophilus]|uniref:TonB family C-terminal domain-containing protein n=1 Tax=Dyadobacter psychrophilus TaxID=651661 RepID=A0A1T5GRD4_9BACT|nr:energy transducer TonB [Dyadobacter psychrophilus]SKC10951.1 TonB family C-terminal domain-containing protein [Dyadobacter psychrophilus]